MQPTTEPVRQQAGQGYAPASPDVAPRSPDIAQRNPGAVLTAIRVAGALVILVSIGLFVVGLIRFNSGLRTPCAEWHLAEQAFCEQRLRSLAQLGTDLNFFVTFNVVGIFVEIAPWIILSLLIFWRKSSEIYEMLFACAVILFATFAIDNGPMVSATYFHPELQPLVDVMSFLASCSLIIWFVFPDGRFVPRWTRWVALAWVVRNLGWLFFRHSPLDSGTWPNPVPQVLVAAFVATLIYSLLYRYRRASDQVQRQRMKWVALGALVYGPVAVSRLFLDTGSTPSGTVTDLTSGGAAFVMSFVFATCLGVSILRYRLWDIDLILSRTLVYLPLTAIVAGIFSASISLTQRFFLARTGSTSEMATGIATLVTVALFDPIKSAIQRTVDAHFKEGSDPAARLKAFGEVVEGELGVLDARRVAHRLLHEAVAAFGACSGAVYLGSAGGERLVGSHGEWRAHAHVTVPLEAGVVRLGRLELGERANGAGYGRRDEESLQRLAAKVAQALAHGGAWAE